MWVNARLLREPGEALIPSSFDVISFTKVAGNWKAIMVVPGRSSMYEITYDLEEKSHIISEYHRIRSDRLDAI